MDIVLGFLKNYEVQVINIYFGESEVVWNYEMDLIENNRKFFVFNVIFVKVFSVIVSKNVFFIKDVDLLNDMVC